MVRKNVMKKCLLFVFPIISAIIGVAKLDPRNSTVYMDSINRDKAGID